MERGSEWHLYFDLKHQCQDFPYPQEISSSVAVDGEKSGLAQNPLYSQHLPSHFV